MESSRQSRQNQDGADPDAHQWVVEPGMFDLLIGSSSAAIQASVPYRR